jgi:hypothetical protein
MNHRHRKVLHALFAHPVSANIHANDVEAVLTELGAELEQVRQLRRFLESCGIDASAYPS